MTDRAMELVVEAGKTMLENGGEVFRAQDTMEIMARSLGVQGFHVYVLTNGIFASAESEAGELSAVRHIPRVRIHLGRVEAVNALSRQLAAGGMDLAGAEAALAEASAAAVPRGAAGGPVDGDEAAHDREGRRAKCGRPGAENAAAQTGTAVTAEATGAPGGGVQDDRRIGKCADRPLSVREAATTGGAAGVADRFVTQEHAIADEKGRADEQPAGGVGVVDGTALANAASTAAPVPSSTATPTTATR